MYGDEKFDLIDDEKVPHRRNACIKYHKSFQQGNMFAKVSIYNRYQQINI